MLNEDRFFNPIRQNAIHTRAIQDFLKLPNKAIHSVIVFGESCTLKKVEMTSSNVHVIKREELKRFIQAQQKSASPIFFSSRYSSHLQSVITTNANFQSNEEKTYSHDSAKIWKVLDEKEFKKERLYANV
ncbi:nuclease-related domain-containing protein [Lysinibacillus pakistanensis]|uniref:nuclease-related domain-containing protein n=1 Tax=Lysinibacillus pakistanensis TaxID=759811 RepID=UPI003D289ADE